MFRHRARVAIAGVLACLLMAGFAFNSGGLPTMLQVSAGSDQSNGALASDGTVWTWGYAGNGQSGTGTIPAATCYQSQACYPSPVHVVGPDGTGTLNNVTHIAEGGGQVYATTADGTLFGWGTAPSGQFLGAFGNGQSSSPTPLVPVVVALPTGSPSSATYTYDGDGLRTSKTVNGITTHEAWDRGASLPMLLDDGTNQYVYGPGGAAIEQVDGNGTPVYLHQDASGSTRAITDATGSVVATYTYDTFGNVTSHTGTATTPLQYSGQYTDAETGLQYLRARYYDPTVGGFLSVDPLLTITHSAYGYANGNPVNASDPSGMGVFGSDVCFAWDSGCASGAQIFAQSDFGKGANGFADSITGGVSSNIEGAAGAAPNKCDPAFRAGQAIGTVVNIVFAVVSLPSLIRSIASLPRLVTSFARALTKLPDIVDGVKSGIAAFARAANADQRGEATIGSIFGIPGDASDALAARAAQIRTELNVGANRVVAVGRYTIDGGSGELVSVSGQAERAGTVGVPREPRFNPTAGPVSRPYDAEYKLIEELSTRITPTSSGIAKIYVDGRPICDACLGVINQFKTAFPNISLQVTSNG